MQFSTALVALVAASLASAQSLPSNIPACSLNCFVTALSADGCSDLTDFACHCAKPSLVGEVTPCVEKACDAADQSIVSSIVVSECSAVGVPVSIPPVGGATTSSAAPETTSTASAVVPPPASYAPVTAPGTAAPTPVATVAPSAPSAPAASSTAVASTPLAPSASPSTSTFGGAATNLQGSLAGVVAAAAAVAYVL